MPRADQLRETILRDAFGCGDIGGVQSARSSAARQSPFTAQPAPAATASIGPSTLSISPYSRALNASR